MIPEEKRAAVARCLNEAFGVSEFESIEDLTERPGSNRAFRIVVEGTSYLLRINTRPGDMARHFACMRAAAEAGLAPRVLYSSAEDRASITDFVVAVPFVKSDALRHVPVALRILHSLAAFPTAPFNTTCTFLLNQGPMLDGFLEKFRVAKVMPEPDLEELLAQFERIATICRGLEPDLTPSHNDLFKPDNMLFDRSRLWLVDWEASFQNDRYADLAVVANMLVADQAEERDFLTAYFGAPPTAYQSARLHLMQQLAHVFYALAFLNLGATKKPIDWSEGAPEYSEFQQRFWAREVGLADDHSKAVFGRAHLEELRRIGSERRFEESVRAVGDGQHAIQDDQ